MRSTTPSRRCARPRPGRSAEGGSSIYNGTAGRGAEAAACAGLCARPKPIMLRAAREVAFQVNGREARVVASPETPLLYILRNDLGLNGPKYGCGLGECGACAVLVGDHAVRACAVPLGAVAGRSVTTLEGLGSAGAPHPVQVAFIAHQAAQCGYCLNGMIIAVVALLRRMPRPSEAHIRQALRHHLCRCGAHMEILAAVRAVAADAAPSNRPGSP